MPADKSLFYYGWWFNKLFDPALGEGRARIVDLVDMGSSVLDLGCGTGRLSAALRAAKRCRVTAIDLSTRMLDFARTSIHDDAITFVHHDATDLAAWGDASFDFAAIAFMMHELRHEQQKRVVREALRVARRVIMVDCAAPLPRNLEAVVLRFVEATFGHDHHANFLGYLARGGLDGIIREISPPVDVAHRSIFEHGCRELLAVSAR